MRVPGEANIDSVQAIAIVGAALRFPGASDPASFHELTVAGRRMFRELTDAPASAGSSAIGERAGRPAGQPFHRAALLDHGGHPPGDDVPPADGVTGQHLLAAETAAAALADVPAAGRSVATRVGVFIADIPQPGSADMRRWVGLRLGLSAPNSPGSPAEDHGGEAVAASNAKDSPAAHGAANGAAVANAVLPAGLHCSLRAVTEACEALNAAEFDLTLAGGVAKGIESWSAGPARALATENIRVYDACPTGLLPGEGCGVVALVRAADARALGLPVYAEIVGWHAAGPATPPRAVVPTAYLRAGIDPADVQFIEGHGAATATDDLDELATLVEVIGHRPATGSEHTGGEHIDREHTGRERCALGSVSANIGDTRAAAGIAALLKTAFAMTADTIPPSTGCVQPNRLLLSDTVPFRLPYTPEPWPQTPVLLAAVNSLGASPYPDAPRSGPVHVVLRRERDLAHRPGRRRKHAD
jgi:enediyne polyketide synthase